MPDTINGPVARSKTVAVDISARETYTADSIQVL